MNRPSAWSPAIVRAVTIAALKAAAALIVGFVLARVLGPNLINAHDDLLGWLGLACFLAAPVPIVWAAYSLHADWVRARNQPAQTKEES